MGELYTKISELCASADISISQLCRDIDISRSVLSELKSGRSRTLSVKNIALISKYFDIPKDFLFGAGVFKNWREIMDNIEPVFSELRFNIPRNFSWHESDDSFLYAYLETTFYYGDNLPIFLNWLYEAVEEIKITKNEQIGYFDYGIPPVEVKFLFRRRFKELLDKHQEKQDDTPQPMRAISMREAVDDFIERHQYDTSEEAIAELLGVFRKLTFSSKRQLLGKAYELLESQQTPPTGDKIAPPDISLVASVLDRGTVDKK